MTIYVAVNPKYTGKIGHDHPRKWDYNNTFENMELETLRDLAVWTYKGHPYCGQHLHVNIPYEEDGETKHHAARYRDNFIRSNVFSLDYDKKRPEDSVSALMRHPFMQKYAGYLYATTSSTVDSPKTRVVFLCDTVIEDVERYSLLARAFAWHFQDADQSCFDPLRIFAGSKLSHEVKIHDSILPLMVLDRFAVRFQEHLRAQQEEKQRKLAYALAQGDTSVERIRAALRHIPANKGSLIYYDWMKVVRAIYSAYPNDLGVALAEEWSGERNAGEVPVMFRSFGHYSGNEITVNSLFWMAKQRGWTEPARFKTREEGIAHALMKSLRRRQ
jgi:hypothetical protein